MIIGTVTNGLAITSPIAMGIIMTGAKVSIVTTISILPPDEAIDAFTAGSTAIIMIFTMTDLIPTTAAAIVGGTEAGTIEDIAMTMGGMATGTGMVIGMGTIDRDMGIIHSDNGGDSDHR